MQNSMMMLNSFVLDPKYHFWGNLSQKIKNYYFRLNECSFFPALHQKCRFWANLVQKIKIVILSWNFILKFVFFKLKFCNQTNMNMRNSMVMLIFSALDRKYHFFGPKNQNCFFKLKFRSQPNLNMQNSMMMLIFSPLHQKYRFQPNLVQKIKIVILSWNLVLKLIWVCRIRWWCTFFLL